jgi:DNA-directed RNA polymerase specialized sigma24 family protein
VRDFEEAFDGLYRLGYRVAYRLLGRRAESEDVALEALARAYARWPRVRDHAEAWVATVSTNLALDHLRRTARRGLLPAPAGAVLDGAAADRVDLSRALSALSRRQREVLALRYLADMPEEAVAAALGCSVGSVKQYASRGLAALRRAETVGEVS